MTQIKIEVPANDHIALSAMADALQRIASERQLQDTVHDFTEGNPEYVKAREEFKTPNGDDYVEPTNVKFENTTTEEQYNENMLADQVDTSIVLSTDTETLGEITGLADSVEDDTLDADGLPWDKRIHSRGKTRLSDNTWRLTRKPKDKTDEEWSSYVESVKAELKAVQDIPTLDEQCDDVGIVRQEAVTPTLDEQAVADLTPPVVDESTAPTLTPPVIDNEAPVAPVTPPTSLTPPVVEPTVEADTAELSDWDKWLIKAKADAKLVETFQELMLYITGNAKKRGADNDMIKATLAEVDPALTAIPLIATRADLIPKFVTALEAKLS